MTCDGSTRVVYFHLFPESGGNIGNRDHEEDLIDNIELFLKNFQFLNLYSKILGDLFHGFHGYAYKEAWMVEKRENE